MSEPDANGVTHNSNPWWATPISTLGGLLIGLSVVAVILTTPAAILGVLVGGVLVTAALYPTTETAYWRTVERHRRTTRKASL